MKKTIVSLMFMSLFANAVMAAPPTMEEIRPYLDEIRSVTSQQQPFFLFPEENNGVYEYHRVVPLDCAELKFRDSIGLRKTNGYFSFFRTTRLLSLYDVEFVTMETASPTNSDYVHYTVNFGAEVKEIARLIYGEREDETGIHKVADSGTSTLVLRYSTREDAERVYRALDKLVRLCQEKD